MEPVTPQFNSNRVVFVGQVIVSGMILGVLTFIAIALLVFENAPDDNPTLSYAGILFGVVALIAQPLIKLKIPKEQLDQMKSEKTQSEETEANVCGLFLTELIVKLAILEGAAFFNGVMYLLEHQMWSIGIALFLAVGLAIQFPTYTRLQQWIEQRTLDLQFSMDAE